MISAWKVVWTVAAILAIGVAYLAIYEWHMQSKWAHADAEWRLKVEYCTENRFASEIVRTRFEQAGAMQDIQVDYQRIRADARARCLKDPADAWAYDTTTFLLADLPKLRGRDF